MLLACGLSGCFDNMYPTSNYHHSCSDSTYSIPQFCQTDGVRLTYGFGSSVDSTRRAVIAAVMTRYGATDLVIAYHASPVYSGADETDVVFLVGQVPPGADGIVWCEDALTTRACDQHYVRFRSSSTTSQYLVCHEVGHAVGLTHGGDAAPATSNSDPALGCMVTPGQLIDREIGAHNATMINETY